MIPRLLILIIFFSGNALACSTTGAVIYNPNVIGKVISVKKVDGVKNRAVASILILDSKSEEFIVGQTYNFFSKSSALGLYADSCAETVYEGKSYELHLKKSERQIGNGLIISGLLWNIPAAQITDKEKFDTVNQALKAQPPAAGTPLSGAP